MSAQPAARVEDPIAHTQAKTGMMLGILAGVVVGAVLVGATIATGGAALAVVAAVGGAAGLTSFGGLSGMNIGAASMGPPTGQLKIGSPNVFINARPATMTAMAMGICSQHAGPIPLATGSSTVLINGRMAGRQGETMGCSAVVVAMCSPDVLIGGASAADPAVTIKPEVPPWAVGGLVALGLAGAIMALPFAITTVGVAATIGGGVAGYLGSELAGKGMRALGEAMGMSEAGVRAMEAGGQFFGGMAGGWVGVKGGKGASNRVQAALVTRRRERAQSFYHKQGMAADDVPDHLKGIDFKRPVKVVTLKQGTQVDQLQVPGAWQGNYYAPPGTPPSKIGIAPQGRDYTTGAIVDKVPTRFTATRDVEVLRSTAAPVHDTWSVRGSSFPTKGGATQYFSMDKGAFGK